ncbi:MAG: class I SAM-dependent methyltransferase [Chloroflexi bacterium]|nr:class I SAM-dependent methyltransferase [Chloroflexota bacterium]
MSNYSRLGDFILGLQGVAILRNHWIDPAAVRAWTRSIAEVATRIDEEPWSEPWHAEERTVRAQYAAWAAGYDAPGNPMVMAEEPIVHSLLASYPVGMVLDAACGTGRHVAYLSSLGHEVIGIDCTPEMLDVAKAKTPAARFETADLLALPLPDNAVDLAVCTLALTHFTHLGQPLAELARVVRPGGRVVLSDVHPFMVMLGSQAVDMEDDTSGFTRNYIHLHSDYLAAFQTAGLDVVQCVEPLWSDEELTAFADIGRHVPGLLDAAVRGLPIVVVWELVKRV